MRFLTETDKSPSIFDDTSMESRVFVFCPSREDYFLTYNASWRTEKNATVYRFSLGNRYFTIPSCVYVCVACQSGSIDWMLTDDLIGKNMSLLTMSRELKNWKFEELWFSGKENKTYHIPITKNPYPVVDDTRGDLVILVSSVDQYHKFKNFEYSVFFVG